MKTQMNPRAWAGVLAFLSTLAGAADIPCCTKSAEEEAHALIGREYADVDSDLQLVPELSCLAYGSVMLRDRHKRSAHLAGGLVRCIGRYVMVLKRDVGDGTLEGRRWRVIDARALPSVVGTEPDPAKPEGPYLFVDGECAVLGRGQADGPLIAVVRLGKKGRTERRWVAQSAWGFNLGHERIERRDVKRVVCHEPGP